MSTEAAYQNALLAALFGGQSSLVGVDDATAAQGLAIYQNNGALNAIRALSLMFPSVHALLGEDDFAGLARLYWRARPPTRGDWSQYGVDFGSWVADQNPGGVVTQLPFLPDLLRLDDALTRCQDAPDATADLSTLALLEGDPAQLRLVLHPSVNVLSSAYDLVDYRKAILDSSAPESAAMLTPTGQQTKHIQIVRQGWRAVATRVDDAHAIFVRKCLSGATLLQAHEAACAADALFDAGQWLSQAITAQLIWCAEPV